METSEESATSMASPQRESKSSMIPKEEAITQPKQYHLLCDTMSCDACEAAVVATLSSIPNVSKVEASRAQGTIVVSTNSCNSCVDCQCCQCDPCSCEVCRCCACGVDKYLAALEDIDHHATYPTTKKSDTPSESRRASLWKFPQNIDISIALALGVACFAIGSMLKGMNSTLQM
jgi:copper chaperone CopZ